MLVTLLFWVPLSADIVRSYQYFLKPGSGPWTRILKYLDLETHSPEYIWIQETIRGHKSLVIQSWMRLK